MSQVPWTMIKPRLCFKTWSKEGRLGTLNAPSEHAEFRITLQRIHKGTTYVAFKGAVRQGSASERWCLQYNMPKSATYVDSELASGEGGAHTMADFWRHRLHFLFSLYENARGQASNTMQIPWSITKSHQSSVVFVESAPRAQLNRVRWLRSLTPS